MSGFLFLIPKIQYIRVIIKVLRRRTPPDVQQNSEVGIRPT
jgi:hypothetical protein